MALVIEAVVVGIVATTGDDVRVTEVEALLPVGSEPSGDPVRLNVSWSRRRGAAVVLTRTARGFETSLGDPDECGRILLNPPDLEIADVSASFFSASARRLAPRE